jgi:flagellar motility protein MotE (MotC chaperone)
MQHAPRVGMSAALQATIDSELFEECDMELKNEKKSRTKPGGEPVRSAGSVSQSILSRRGSMTGAAVMIFLLAMLAGISADGWGRLFGGNNNAMPSAAVQSQPQVDAAAPTGSNSVAETSSARGSFESTDPDRGERLAEWEKRLVAQEAELLELQKELADQLTLVTRIQSDHAAKLARLYEGMDPAAVAKLFEKLDDATIATLLPGMKTKVASAVLENLPPERGASLSEILLTLREKR